MREWVITAISRLSGEREQISGRMTKQEADERLEREKASRRYQRYKPYKSLRVEFRQPEQLLLQFRDAD